nr:ketopantoate reductase family protein [uncultured Bacillus sp.]
MRKIETVSLIGLGAIGATYGSKFHDTFHESFQVVADPERIKKYEKNGIQINNRNFHFHYVTPEMKGEPADLVIFAVKNAELPGAIIEMENHIGPNTIILSLLNGLTSEEEIYQATGNEHILYSMSVEIDAVRHHQDIHYTTMGRICYGEKDASQSQDVKAVQELFERCGIAYEISDNMLYTLWWKFMINVGINQTSAILKASYGVFQQIPLAYKLVEAAMYEVVAISEKADIHLTDSDVKKFWPILNHLSPYGKTSMLQDVEAGRKTEVENFAGVVCQLGEKYGVPTPVNKQLLLQIRIIEEMANLSL